MATVQTHLMTADEFWEWAGRQENQDRWYELNRGEVVEVPPPGFLHGVVCILIGRILSNYTFQKKAGVVCGNDTGLLVEKDPDSIRGPDVMLFDQPHRYEDLSPKYATEVPRLIVEVLSPHDQMSKTNRRISQYLNRGVPLVWLVDPEVRSVTVYRPGEAHRVLEEADELTGEDVLPDLRLRVAELFTLPGEVA
jgi:Uma2 family endonuclease